MMTTLNVQLSSKLQTTLGQPGVWAYAVYFTGGNPTWHKLVDNGAIQDSGTVSVPMPFPFVGGKVYFLVQSQTHTQPNNLETLITTESDINWGNADSWDFRYDSFEVTLQNGIADQGNLTSVNGFGLPMELSVSYDDGTISTRGYGIKANDLFTDLKATSQDQVVYTYGSGPLSGNDREAISPSEAVALNPANPAFKASDWTGYVNSLKTASPGVEVAGFFNGAADTNGVWHNSGFFSYALEWDSNASVFWLSPADNSEIQGYIRITPTALANSIYSTLGDVGIYTSKSANEAYQIFKHSDPGDGNSMNSGENNQWGEVLTQFLTGFTAGYFGTKGTSLNPKVTGSIDLDKNWNWDPTYAFGKNLDGPPAPHFDPYSAAFFFNSNSYGSGYSDNLTDPFVQGGPLISVSQPDQAQNVDSIDITIYDDDETPGGYETPVIYNYIAGGYEQPNSASSPNNIKLNFANQGMVLSESTTVSLDIYTGDDVSGDPTWQTVSFTPTHGQSLWQNWKINKTGSTYTAELQPNTPQGTGQMLITNLPNSGDAGTYWYRLNIGSGDDAKTFNLYTKMAAGAGGTLEFVNPNVAGQAGSLAIDGLATISPEQANSDTIETFTVNFMYSASVTVDPDLLERDPNISGRGAPNAPVGGTLSGSTFTALDGQTQQVTNTITATDAQIAFGWTGLNSTPDAASWISGYTNKIGALNYAQISIAHSGGQTVTIHTQADLDGQWMTAATQLGNGTYTVTMEEYLSSALSTAIPPKSSALNLTVDVATAPMAAAGDGLELVLSGVDDPAGNWISLEAIQSSIPAGTTLLLYAVDAQGDLVSRDGSGSGPQVTLDQAVRGTIGAVHDDAGAALHLGAQSVYLEAGHSLQFAVLSANGQIDLDPTVDIIQQTGGPLKVSVDGIHLIAETDNTLTDSGLLGGTQRATGEAFLYLEQGATMEIDLFGSCGTVNTLGFVRKDVNTATGEWSVDGVAYGDTQEFRDAVLANLDGGFEYSNGGDFRDTVEWTVEGETGFYAPVLVTTYGEVLVVGDANPGGHDQIRMYGHNTFGFEDLTSERGSDFDYNDMVMRVTPLPDTDLLM